ncbi:ATP-binding protein [Allosphingosinicella humi]
MTESEGSEAAPWRAIALIVGFSLAVILLTWTAVIEQARFERAEAVTSAMRQTNNRVIAFEQYVTRTLEAADAATHHLADKRAAIGGTPDKPAWISDPVVNNAMFGAVSIVDENGYIIATTAKPPPKRMNAMRRNAVRVHVARDTGQLYIGEARQVRTLGRAMISLTRRINKPDGSFGGVVAIQMEPSQFTRFYEHSEVKQTDLMSVIGFDGFTRARRTGDRVSYGENLNGMLVMDMQRRHPNGHYVGPGALDGVVRYFSHRRLEHYPLFVTVGIARDEVLAPLDARRFKYDMGALLVTLGTIAFAGVLITGLRRRQRSALAIATANARLHEAQRIARMGDWDYDLQTGVIRWSDHLYSMYERDPALGPPSYEEAVAHCTDAGRRTIARAVDTAVQTGVTQEFEVRAHLPSGSSFYVKTVAIPTRDASGKVIRLHGVDQDVSATKLLESLQAKVAHLSRIDAMNTMAATLAHELNQPLAAATNYLAGSRRLVERDVSDERQLLREGILGADQQVGMAAQIIRRIRDMVANRGTISEAVLLPQIVDDSVSLVAMSTKYPGVVLTKSLDPRALRVMADRVQIQQVLINLVRNACDATAHADRPQVVIFSDLESEDFVRISVIDNGPGIADAIRDIFSPFASSKTSGLGLGLSISRTIIEAHRGRIWVERSSKAGTMICFTLPLARASIAEIDTQETSAAGGR